MKKLVLLLCLFGICACTNPTTEDENNKELNQNSETTVITITFDNYERYLRYESKYVQDAYVTNRYIEFNGALTFAIYNVTISYAITGSGSGSSSPSGNYTLLLDASGYGITKKINEQNQNIKIVNAVGTVEYRL